MQVGYRPQIRAQQPQMQHMPSNIMQGINMAQMPNMLVQGEIGFDGKMLRKSVARKTVDHNPSVVKYLEDRIRKKDFLDDRSLQADPLYTQLLTLPQHMLDNPVSCVMTKFIRAALNKDPRPVFCVCWTPDGRRLITGASSGEFTLWNGLTFNFETILQAHNSSVRAMIWSHNEQWMLTGDDKGYVKYWQANMNNVKMFQGHLEAIRGLSFSPTDQKFTSCSDDRTVRIFDFVTCTEESVLQGHGSDVKCVDWHPHKALIISGSKDSQQPIILWDAKSSKKITTIHAHKNTCTDLKWNQFNGNWLISSSRDHLCKLFDIRNLKEEVQSFRGHKKDACTVAWHPIYEKLFASGGADGSIFFWLCGVEKEIGNMEDAHDGMIWDLSWHPLGHMLVSGSNDRSTRFWTRNRPGDTFSDKVDEISTPKAERSTGIIFKNHELPEIEKQKDGTIILPGLGLEPGMIDLLNEDYKDDSPNTSINNLFSPASKQNSLLNQNQINLQSLQYQNIQQQQQQQQQQQKKELLNQNNDLEDDESKRKKAPYSKPIPKEFEKAWKSNKAIGTQPQTAQTQQLQQQQPMSLMAQPLMSAPNSLLNQSNQSSSNNKSSSQPISLLDLMSTNLEPVQNTGFKRKLSQDFNDNSNDNDDDWQWQNRNNNSNYNNNYNDNDYEDDNDFYDDSGDFQNQNQYNNNSNNYNNRRNSSNRRGLNNSNSYNHNDGDNSWNQNDDSNHYNNEESANNRNRNNNNNNSNNQNFSRPRNNNNNRGGFNNRNRNNN